MVSILLKLIPLSIITSTVIILIITDAKTLRDILSYNYFLQIFLACLVSIAMHKSKLQSINLANYITYFRLIIIITLLILILSRDDIDNVYYSLYFIFFSFLVFIMDWLDGYIARKLKQITDFGFLFDQEVDNIFLFILVLSITLSYSALYFLWLIPLLRYIFLLMKYAFVWMRSELYDSMRRKSICAITTFMLIISNLEVLSFFLVELLSIISLTIIVFSFIKDILWLYRRNNA